MSRAFRIGAFIVGSLAILAIGIFLVGNKKFLFSSTYRLKAPFISVEGLTAGAEVRIGGLHKGTVKRIDLPLQPNQKVTVSMDLESPTRDVIKRDSIASIQTEGLLGDKFVSITFGSRDAGDVNDGDTISTEPPYDISDLIKKTNDILDSSKTVMTNLGVVSENAKVVAENAKSITAKINQGKGTIGALINDKQMYGQLNETVAQARKGVTAFGEDMEALKQNWLFRGFFRRRGYVDSADLTKDEIPRLPRGNALKTFTYDAKQLFDKPDTAELKNKKALKDVGQFLEQNQFGLAVVVGYSGMKGASEKDLVLSQARAMVVHDYLAEYFELDDTRLRTLAVGKDAQTAATDVGRVEVIIYPVGTEMPPA
jgi:phospholipid/cholesterol/gamma-HCH transport system substrate-binding protein